jgi:hypothetical protein
MMMSATEDITIEHLHSVTIGIDRNDPAQSVLRVETIAGAVVHYGVHVSDLAALAELLAPDAALLSASPAQPAPPPMRGESEERAAFFERLANYLARALLHTEELLCGGQFEEASAVLSRIGSEIRASAASSRRGMN